MSKLVPNKIPESELSIQELNYVLKVLAEMTFEGKDVLILGSIVQKLSNKLKMVFELANHSIFKYNIQELESVKILKYGVGGKYKWHTDCGAKETSTRKLTAVVQLSDESRYKGGDLEFGITDETGKNNHKANKTRGSITIFPSFLSHRVTPITKGTRHSLITWMLGDCFV